MELSISDEKTKELLTEVVLELLKTKRNVLYDVVLEALEEVGLKTLSLKVEKMNLFQEDEVLSIIDGASK